MEEEEKKGPTELIVQQKVYDMIVYAYPALEQFPKSQKFSLAQDIKKCLDMVMRLVVTANKKYTKKNTLQELDVEIATLKVYIRMAHDLGYLPPKKYEHWGKLIVEVGRMVGGWIKATKENRPVMTEMEPSAEGLQCGKCGMKITQKIKAYSEMRYGIALCYKCQKEKQRDEEK